MGSEDVASNKFLSEKFPSGIVVFARLVKRT